MTSQVQQAKGVAAPRRARSFRAMAALIALTACQLSPEHTVTALPHPISAPRPPSPDAETRAAQAHYRQIQTFYQKQGRLRTDGGGPDTPFSARDLADNFLQIAFFDEFTEKNDRLTAGGDEKVLHRWQGPLRVKLAFGATLDSVERARDSASIDTYFARLARLTGLNISLTDTDPNFIVAIAGPAEKRSMTARVLAFAPKTSTAALISVTEMREDIYCTVFSYSPGQFPIYDRAFAVIRAELPPLMRRMCYHEELAQALGLVNDSPRARPSIFNDNEEFAYLTRQDELLLRILYDHRLRPGMSLRDARPIVEMIASELKSDAS